MSMDYGGQSDPWKWGDDNVDGQQNDWNNSCAVKPPAPPGNYKQVQDQSNNLQSQQYVNKSNSDFFETVNLHNRLPSTNYTQDFSFHTNPPYQPNTQNDSLLPPSRSHHNNNNTISEVENKEIAPPDNKYPRSSSPQHNHGVSTNSDTIRHFMPPHQESSNSYSPQHQSMASSMPLFPPTYDRNSFVPAQPAKTESAHLNHFSGYNSMPGRPGYIPPPNAQQHSFPPHINQAQSTLPQHSQSQPMPSQLNQSSSKPPQHIPSQSMPLQFSQSPSMPHQRTQSSFMHPQHNQPLSMPPQHTQQQSVPPQHGQQRSMPPQHGQQPSMPPQNGQQPSIPPPHGQQPSIPPPHGQQPSIPPPHGQQSSIPPPHGQQPSIPLPHGQQPSIPPPHGQQPSMPPQQSQPNSTLLQHSQLQAMPIQQFQSHSMISQNPQPDYMLSQHGQVQSSISRSNLPPHPSPFQTSQIQSVSQHLNNQSQPQPLLHNEPQPVTSFNQRQPTPPSSVHQSGLLLGNQRQPTPPHPQKSPSPLTMGHSHPPASFSHLQKNPSPPQINHLQAFPPTLIESENKTYHNSREIGPNSAMLSQPNQTEIHSEHRNPFSLGSKFQDIQQETLPHPQGAYNLNTSAHDSQRNSVSPPKAIQVNSQPHETERSSAVNNTNLLSQSVQPSGEVGQMYNHGPNSQSDFSINQQHPSSIPSYRNQGEPLLNSSESQFHIPNQSLNNNQNLQSSSQSNEQKERNQIGAPPLALYRSHVPPDDHESDEHNALTQTESSVTNVPSKSVYSNSSYEASSVEQSQISKSYHYQMRNQKGAYTISSQSSLHPMAASSPLTHVDNLERLPENHERLGSEDLDHQMGSLSINPEPERAQLPVHCSIDRNQYLETGHLSIAKDMLHNDISTNIEPNDEGEAPPPGLDRLVTGQVCETNNVSDDHQNPSTHQIEPLMIQSDRSRQSSPISSIGDQEVRQRISATEGESENGDPRRTERLVQGQSIGDDTDGVREVPGEADPVQSRVVLGQMGGSLTPPIQDSPTPRIDRKDRDKGRGRRMVVGEHSERDPNQSGNVPEDYRQKRKGRHRHRRGDSSFDEEDVDYLSDRDRRNEEFKRREDRPRRRREHRSPEYRSDEEFEERRSYNRGGRNERRRDFSSPDRDYFNYRDERSRYKRYEHYSRGDYDEDYYRENRSRPSSRTGSDYRRSNMDYTIRSQMTRPYYHDHTMNSSGYLEYGKYNNPYEYYEKMRQTDPVRYAAWYEQYMKERFNSMQHSTTYGTDRASVHSGQSSLNQRHNAPTPQPIPERVTRAEDEFDIRLCTTNHIKGKIDGQGRLVLIEPNYPQDGQKATVKLLRLAQPLVDSDTEEFFESPGPFIPGVTHRNTVLQYLKRISEKATKSSEKLLYDLIHLTVKGNGEVNEIDVAELLMNSYKKSEREENEKTEEIQQESLPEKEVVAKFRELLQQGNKTEALDWAINHGAWGHALFLASKMDDRTHNQIMLRFANSIPHNDPLQTLYQLMSGHIPQSSTCCADKKWSDWRPHLAMILGNPTQNPALDRKAIIRLGDSLRSHGRLFAAHFCYVTAQVEFSNFKPDAKLVLLGSSPDQDFNKFASCRAIMLTMCFEYGLKLRQRDYHIPTLQLYKLILALRLIDNGRSKIALQYLEMLANEALQSRECEKGLIAHVIDVSSRLKMLDPTLALSGETNTDPEWLYKLKLHYDELPESHDAGMKMNHGISSSTISELGQDSQNSQNDPGQEAHDNLKLFNDPYSSYNATDITHSSQFLAMQPVLSQQLPTDVNKEEQVYQPSFVMNPPLQQNTSEHEQPPVENMGPSENYWTNSSNMGNTNSVYDGAPQQSNYSETTNNTSNNFFKTSEEQLKLNEVGQDTKKPRISTKENKVPKNEEQRSGWLGGIWDKLSMKPKNQMRLPDDSNPSIVWNQEKKRWVNLEGENEDTNALKPPPKASDLQSRTNLPINSFPGVPSSNTLLQNKYKLQKGKLMKSNYVDVMGGSSKDKNQSGAPQSSSSLPPTMVKAPINNIFIPQPVEGNENAPIDFITPAPINPPQNIHEAQPDGSNKQLSRCSSVSSLSREVQYYMSPPSAHSNRPASVQQPSAPMMYNPTRFPS